MLAPSEGGGSYPGDVQSLVPSKGGSMAAALHNWPGVPPAHPTCCAVRKPCLRL